MKYLVDSDFLYGLSIATDGHHKASSKVFRKLINVKKVNFCVINLVIQETATVISRKIGQKESLIFLNNLIGLPIKIIVLGEEDENLGWGIFKKQTKKETSFIDCANLAMYQKYKFDGVLSFDEFYPENVRAK